MEMQLWKDKVSNDAVDTIFIGGGTPSLLTEGQFDVLQNEMVKSFHLSDKMEYTIECNPGTVDAEKLKNYKEYDENSNMSYVHVKEKNATDIKEYCREIAEKYNLPVAFNNQYFRYVNRVISADQLGVLGIFI